MGAECEDDRYFLDNLTCAICRRSFESGSVNILDRKFVSGMCDSCKEKTEETNKQSSLKDNLDVELSSSISRMQRSQLAALAWAAIFLATVFNYFPRGIIGVLSSVALLACCGLYFEARHERELAKRGFEYLARRKDS